MARRRATETDLINRETYLTIYNKYKLIAMNEFVWEGLPPGMESRHIERELFDHGKAGFFNAGEHTAGYLCLHVDPGHGVNVYNDPTEYIMMGVGKRYHRAARNCVIIENNILRLPTHDFIAFYARKIYEIERTADVNVKANKSPVVLLCDDKDLLTFKRIYQEADGNTPAIFVDKSLNLDMITSLDLKAKFICNELTDYKHSEEAELLTFLGIDNPAVDKKERLITDEANSNNQLIESFAQLQLEARERACKEIRQKFGLDITVKRRNTQENQQPVDKPQKEGFVK